jgi:hypothetical protein
VSGEQPGLFETSARSPNDELVKLDAKLRKVDRTMPDALPEHDAEYIARLIHRRWGDQAPAVLEHALELVRSNLDTWKR